MQSGMRLKAEEVDRLSSLPDDLIYKILSYVDIIYCVRLSVLSSRWKFIPGSMPDLNFASDELYSITKLYDEFVKYVLSARDNKIDVSSVSLKLSREVNYPELSVQVILEYALSHNVQQLSITSSIQGSNFPYSLLSSKSLKYLRIIGIHDVPCLIRDWYLPALTTLHLHHVILINSSSSLATCQNLKNLTLERCEVCEPDNDRRFTITNPRLVSLTLKKVKWYVKFVYLDTPQLTNFVFVDTPPREDSSRLPPELTIFARDLNYIRIKGSYFPKLSLDGFCSLEKMDLCISSPQETDVHKIHDLFQRLHSVKSLSLSLEIVEFLSTLEAVISQPSPFPSLKSLKIYPSKGLKTLRSEDLEDYPLKSSLEMFPTQYQEQEATKTNLSVEVTNYLIDSSSNATFTMVSHEEARATKITKVAYRLMEALRKILEKMVAYSETIRANVEWKKPLADSCLEDFSMRIRPRVDNEVMFFILHNIKVLLPKVLASKRVEMQARYSRLSAKSKNGVNKMVADMKNQWDMKQRIFSGYFNEIDSSS